MWKCSQCETLNGDDSPICIICGMSREEVLAEQKQLELERALAASIPAKKPEVTLNWPKEEDTSAPEEPAKRPRWKDLRDSMDEQTRDRWLLAGRVLAFAALLVLFSLHLLNELSLCEYYEKIVPIPAPFWWVVHVLIPPSAALLIPGLLGKKLRTEACLAAAAFTLVYFMTAVSLENELRVGGFASQFPSLLLGIVLVICAAQGEIRDWVVPTMRAVTIVSAIAFFIFTVFDSHGLYSTLFWDKFYLEDIFLTGFYFAGGTHTILCACYPLSRVFLALAVTLLFRANREK